MPASKKHPAVHKKPAKSTAKPKHRNLKRSASKAAIEKTADPVASNPPKTPVPPARPTSPLPMPVKPQQLPSKIQQPLTKTTYNTNWIKRLVVVFVVGLIIMVGFVAWSMRDALVTLFTKSSTATEQPYHLNLAPTPAPDKQKLANLTKEWGSDQGSNSAQPSSPSTTPSDVLVKRLNSQSSGDLDQELENYISRLGAAGVDITNLQAYQEKIQLAHQNDDEQAARNWLIEALLHAHELELLHNYYK